VLLLLVRLFKKQVCAIKQSAVMRASVSIPYVTQLYDARNYSAGPFAAFTVTGERNSNAVFAVLRFSLDGKYLLGVVEGRIYVLDAFTGETLRFVSSGIPEGGMALEACLTADGRYILSGCWDRYIRAWSVETGNVVGQWQQHADIPTCLKFSPRKMMVASACQALCFWIPGEAAISAARQRQHVSATIHAPAIQQWHQPGMRMV
jgi:WD40 repeat protein